jgi:hypothetical protein
VQQLQDEHVQRLDLGLHGRVRQRALMNLFNTFLIVSFLLKEKMAPLVKFMNTHPPRRLLALPSVM